MDQEGGGAVGEGGGRRDDWRRKTTGGSGRERIKGRGCERRREEGSTSNKLLNKRGSPADAIVERAGR